MISRIRSRCIADILQDRPTCQLQLGPPSIGRRVVGAPLQSDTTEANGREVAMRYLLALAEEAGAISPPP